MTTRDARLRRAAGLAAVALLASVAACGTTSGAEVVGESSKPGWQTIEYHGVRVDIPAAWERVDRSGCEFRFEHWAARGPGTCDGAAGVSFYGSATFDPAHGPGVRRAETGWAGWTDGGEYDVYVAADDRALVGRVLDSVRTTSN